VEVCLIHHLPKLRLLTLTDEFSECHVYLLLGLSATIGSLLGNRAREFVNREVRFTPLRLCHDILSDSDSTSAPQFALLTCVGFSIDHSCHRKFFLDFSG
jgi:hypothetical protein